jgi:hypothetical protein
MENRWNFKLSTQTNDASSKGSNLAKVHESVPQFSPDVFLEHLVSFIVADDQVSPNKPVYFLMLTYLQSIRVVECPEFRRLCMVLRQGLLDADIPRRDKVREAIMCSWNRSFKELQAELSVSLHAFCVPSMLILINRNPVGRSASQRMFGQIATWQRF